MDEEEAPPPYSASDPLNARANNRNGNRSQAATPLRDNAPLQEASSSRLAELSGSAVSSVVPTHFTSAVTYFEQRPSSVIDDGRDILYHHMTIYPRSQAKDFPRRPRCWNAHFDEIIQQDWDTFLRYLFPAQLGLAAASQHLSRQLRAEIQRDRKDRPQETDEQRRARITAVPDAAPTSALCPRCYPAATKATQGTGTPTPVEGQRAVNANALSLVAEQPTPSPNSWHMPHFSPFGNAPQPHMPFGTPFGVPPFAAHGAHNGQPPQYYPQPQPPPGVAPWQWQPWGYTPPQFGPSGTSKSGALGWISSLTSQAQKYGERFAEQAMHYGRQVEEQAMAHGRWLEDQAGLHGRKPGAGAYLPGYPLGYPPAASNGQPPWSPTQTGQTGGVSYTTSTPTSPTSNTTPLNSTESHPQPQPLPVSEVEAQPQAQPLPVPELEAQPQAQRQLQPQPQPQKNDDKPLERSRRASISSVSTGSSFSSIDSLSTTSDLDASDLATVRIQLQSLHDRHDRTLYEAAVDLRQQLSLLEESRREARISGRRDWRRGRQQASQPDSSDWGRWESPEQQQRDATERQAMKEEMRATRKAFRDVARRAREEQRDKRRARKNRLRQRPPPESKPEDEILLDGRMANLALEDTTFRPPARSRTEPVVQAFRPQRTLLRSGASSEISVPGAINTPSSASQTSVYGPAEVPDKKSKLKQMLKSRNAKKQQKAEKEDKDSKASKKDGN
ncbi:uncharacterized protein N7498_004228 [Penicillium cinerascens]|uniref:Uncharacterized protein n=1 Tax=Penicillium cinerascens TaxID=70096 RepID=A0A9W9T7N7_9EURO|nr:uncharacterized protein N7498_004228 [Penicillium cinerascens]KAJ5212582.1 hypothetical protein N7498_004228 [Penicillium cinerascens]